MWAHRHGRGSALELTALISTCTDSVVAQSSPDGKNHTAPPAPRDDNTVCWVPHVPATYWYLHTGTRRVWCRPASGQSDRFIAGIRQKVD